MTNQKVRELTQQGKLGMFSESSGWYGRDEDGLTETRHQKVEDEQVTLERNDDKELNRISPEEASAGKKNQTLLSTR